MPEPLRVESGEPTADEALSALREGRHVVVQAELLGGVRGVTLRHDGTIFHCDTPMTLRKHKDEDGMRACVLKMSYAGEQHRCGSQPRRPLARLWVRV